MTQDDGGLVGGKRKSPRTAAAGPGLGALGSSERMFCGTGCWRSVPDGSVRRSCRPWIFRSQSSLFRLFSRPNHIRSSELRFAATRIIRTDYGHAPRTHVTPDRSLRHRALNRTPARATMATLLEVSDFLYGHDNCIPHAQSRAPATCQLVVRPPSGPWHGARQALQSTTSALRLIAAKFYPAETFS